LMLLNKMEEVLGFRPEAVQDPETGDYELTPEAEAKVGSFKFDSINLLHDDAFHDSRGANEVLPQDEYPWEVFGEDNLQLLGQQEWTTGKAIILQHPTLSNNDTFWLYDGKCRVISCTLPPLVFIKTFEDYVHML
jgi:hypothetical protein